MHTPYYVFNSGYCLSWPCLRCGIVRFRYDCVCLQCGRFQHYYVMYRGVWATFWLGFTVYDIATGSILNFHT